MRAVLDTNVLWDKAALARLAQLDAPRVLPAVAFAERARQFRKRGWSVQALRDELELAGIHVEAMDAVAALRCSLRLLDDADWERLSRDAFIAGHVGPGDILWTRNVGDFLDVGLAPGQIQDTGAL